MRRGGRSVALGLAIAIAITGCTGSPDPEKPTSEGEPTAQVPLSEARSKPVEDSVYPEFGDDRIDTLHHGLDLSWDPDSRILTGEQRITFRAARHAKRFVLDLAPELSVDDAELDGRPVDTRHRDHVLTIDHPLSKGDRHELTLTYSGTPESIPAPTDRADFTHLGFTIEPDGQVWTMQEPHGAHTWYAVNDQPADKALYTTRLSVPSPWYGVSNGELVSQESADGTMVTEFDLTEPTSSYLMTLAFGPYELTDAGTIAGTPLSYWTPSGDKAVVDRLRAAETSLPWLVEKLGPYPFDTLGFVVVPSGGGMETQTMVTLSNSEYATSPEVILHEIAHHWWGDQVSPCDWRDMWMNEGMATYLQTLWTDEQDGRPDGQTLSESARGNNTSRRESGPPGDYDPDSFAEGNVYYPPASMWHELRSRLGDDTFWRLVRDWPQAYDNSCATRTQLIDWWSDESGEDLSPFFQRWLMGETDPT